MPHVTSTPYECLDVDYQAIVIASRQDCKNVARWILSVAVRGYVYRSTNKKTVIALD
jgi:hypothetical protein